MNAISKKLISKPRLQTLSRFGLAIFSTTILAGLTGAIAPISATNSALAQQAAEGRALTLRSDVQEANAVTGVITARGNVQIFYPARQIQATAVQAQYYSRERRIVLSGDVYVLQEGNSLRGETITYLVDEGRFVALPDTEEQVEAIYIVPDPNAPVSTPASATTGESATTEESDFNPKPEFKTPVSP